MIFSPMRMKRNPNDSMWKNGYLLTVIRNDINVAEGEREREKEGNCDIKIAYYSAHSLRDINMLHNFIALHFLHAFTHSLSQTIAQNSDTIVNGQWKKKRQIDWVNDENSEEKRKKKESENTRVAHFVLLCAIPLYTEREW